MRRLLFLALALATPAAAQEAQVTPRVTATVAAGETRLEVRLVSAPGVGAIASVQGEVQLPAGSRPVAAAEFAAGVVGAWNEAEPGRIRFAGVAAQGLGEAPVFVLRLPGAVAAERVRVVLEEAVGADGFRKLVVGRPAPAQPLEDE